MKKPFKVYHNDGQITSITTAESTGKFIVIPEEAVKEIIDNISLYQVVDNKVVNVKKTRKKRPSLKFSDKFDVGRLDVCWMTEKHNIFNCIGSVGESPKTFDAKQYSWVKYDS